jgi:hypothetical protein
MNIVPAVRTPLSAEQARDALIVALPGVDRVTAALLLALVWVETARGNLTNNNAGNISAGSSWPGDAWRPPWFEINALTAQRPDWVALHIKMTEGKAPSAFRSYPTAAAGFADFARVLRSQFQSVLAAAATGDPARFVSALHDSGYSRDYNATHIKTFSSLQDFWVPFVQHLPAGAGGSDGFGAGTALAALALLGFVALNVAAHREYKRDVRASNRRARKAGLLK